jgi:hypothetical protein
MLVGGFNPSEKYSMKASWEYYFQYVESHKIHVPNHQPECVHMFLFPSVALSGFFGYLQFQWMIIMFSRLLRLLFMATTFSDKPPGVYPNILDSDG